MAGPRRGRAARLLGVAAWVGAIGGSPGRAASEAAHPALRPGSTGARIRRILDATRARVDELQRTVLRELRPALAGLPDSDAAAARVTAQVLSKILERAARDPGLEPRALFARVERDLFEGEGGLRWLARKGGTGIEQVLARLRNRFRGLVGKLMVLTNRTAAAAGAAVGIFLGEAAIQTGRILRDEEAARGFRRAALRALGRPEGEKLLQVSRYFLDRGGVSLVLDALDPMRVDYLVLVAEVIGSALGALVALVPGAASPLVAMVLAGAGGGGLASLVRRWRDEDFDPAAHAREVFAEVDARLEGPSGFWSRVRDSGDRALEHVARLHLGPLASAPRTLPAGWGDSPEEFRRTHALALHVKHTQGTGEALARRAREGYAAVHGLRRELLGKVTALLVYLRGVQGKHAELAARLELLAKARGPRGRSSVRRWARGRPAPFVPYPEEKTLGGELLKGRARALGDPASVDVDALGRSLTTALGATLAQIATGEDLGDPGSHPEVLRKAGLAETLRALWVARHRARVAAEGLVRLRVGADRRVDALRAGAGDRFVRGFLTALAVQRTMGDHAAAHAVFLGQTTRRVLAAAISPGVALAAADQAWVEMLARVDGKIATRESRRAAAATPGPAVLARAPARTSAAIAGGILGQ